MRFIYVLVAICISSLAFAKPLPTSLTTTPQGKRIEAFFTAHNAGDSLNIRKFLAENYADSALMLRPVNARIGVYMQRSRNWGALEFHDVLSQNPDTVSVIAHNAAREWFQLDFLFEPREPRKLLGYVGQETDPPADVPEGATLTQAAALDSIKRYVEKLTARDEFSGVVLVAKSGAPILHEAYGLASREYNILNRTDTKFNIGSITKDFTKIAIHQLIAGERLSMSDKLGKYLPDYPNQEAREKVTMLDLYQHTGGIGDFFGEEYARADKGNIRSLQDYLPFFANEPLLFEPGTSGRYSNGGFILLGLIIEKISGQSYYDYVRSHVFAPAGMKHSDWYESDAVVPNLATGYTHRTDTTDTKEWHRNVHSLPAKGSAAGGSYATAEDLLNFVNACEAGKIPGAERGPMGIAGGAPGLSAAIESGIGTGFTIVVLANMDPQIAEDVAQKIHRWLGRVRS